MKYEPAHFKQIRAQVLLLALQYFCIKVFFFRKRDIIS